MPVYKLRNVETGFPYLLLPGVQLLGRSDDADILVDSASISRQHARIHNLENGVFVEDLGSHNGTWMDETYLEAELATKLELGETVYFGGVAFRLDPEVSHVPDPPPASKPAIPHERLRRPTEKVDVSALKNVAQPKSGPIPTALAMPVQKAAPATTSPATTSPATPAGPTVITKHSPTFQQKCFYVLVGLGAGLLLGLLAALAF